MKKLLYIFSFLILTNLTLANVAFAEEASVNEVLSNEDIKLVIEKGVVWLQNAQEKDGHFRYEYMPFLDRYTLDDNIVRQAGALYILGEIAKADILESVDLKDNLETAVGYFEENSADGEFNDYKFRCLKKTESSCTLGGTSLALLGVLDVVAAEPSLKSKYSVLIEDYKNFLLAMKVPDKGYRAQYYLNKNQSRSESPFSNGEAVLALVRYYQYEPSAEMEKLIKESLDYFDETYRAKWDNNFYLWGMAALKDWYQLFPEKKYYDFVKDYTDWRIDGQKEARRTSHNKCAYIEGVVSAYSVLEKQASSKEKEAYLEEINFWLTKSKELQIEKGDKIRISFNGGSLKTLNLKRPSKAVGGFLTDEHEPYQRIDFTQHCLSSYLQKLVDISM